MYINPKKSLFLLNYIKKNDNNKEKDEIERACQFLYPYHDFMQLEENSFKHGSSSCVQSFSDNTINNNNSNKSGETPLDYVDTVDKLVHQNDINGINAVGGVHSTVPSRGLLSPSSHSSPSVLLYDSLRLIWLKFFLCLIIVLVFILPVLCYYALYEQWKSRVKRQIFFISALPDKKIGGIVNEYDLYHENINNAPLAYVHRNSLAYYILCAFAGVLTSIPAIIITPVETIKVRMQVGIYPSFMYGFRALCVRASHEAFKKKAAVKSTFNRFMAPFESAGGRRGSGGGDYCGGVGTQNKKENSSIAVSNSTSPGTTDLNGLALNGFEEESSLFQVSLHSKIQSKSFKPAYLTSGLLLLILSASRHVLMPLAWTYGALSVLYSGWQAVALANSIHGAFKYGFYELCKFYVIMLLTEEFFERHHLVVFLCSAIAAEFISDLALAPWESLKIKIQTCVPASAIPFNTALPVIFYKEGVKGLYRILFPLMGRQIPITAVKFSSFERIVLLIYASGLGDRLTEVQVALLAGMIAGIICGLISHPADTLVSKIIFPHNQASAGISERGGGGEVEKVAVGINRSFGNSSTVVIDVKGAIKAGDYEKSSKKASFNEESSANAISEDDNLRDCLRKIGFRGLFKGLKLRLVILAYITAMQWGIYDGFKHSVGLPTSGKKH